MLTEISQSTLQTLNLLTQNLADASRGMEQQSVKTILKLADTIRSIAQECERLQVQIQNTLTQKAVEERDRVALTKSQIQLQQIIMQCQLAEQPPQSVKKLMSDLAQWKLQFERILRSVEELEAKQVIQQESQQVKQMLQTLQNQAIDLNLENPRKLELLRQLLELERDLNTIDQNAQRPLRDGHDDRQILDRVKGKMEETRSAYGFIVHPTTPPLS